MTVDEKLERLWDLVSKVGSSVPLHDAPLDEVSVGEFANEHRALGAIEQAAVGLVAAIEYSGSEVEPSRLEMFLEEMQKIIFCE